MQLSTYLISLVIMLTLLNSNTLFAEENVSPNFIIIFSDDQGYEDLGIYGSKLINTPNIDQMAKEGMRFTDFYVASSVCSASRAALLTGQRAAINGVEGVYWPGEVGMKTELITIAEMLKPKGYATGAFGKWHLGDHNSTRPTGQGFDEYYGIPYSNDMFVHFNHQADNNIQFNFGYNIDKFEQDKAYVKKHFKDKQKLKKDLNYASPIFEGNKVVEYPADQSLLTQKYFARTKKFINEHKEEPFFIWLTPSMPHIPLFASEKFKGKSKRGLYGDTIEEIDYEVGQLRQYINELGLTENTVIVYASDNGPWLSHKEDAGSAGPFRGGKFTNYEGGLRVPAIITWPKHITSGHVSNRIISAMDLFPTIAELAGVKISAEHYLDGKTIVKHLMNPTKLDNKGEYFYNYKGKIAGIRQGSWKYLRAQMASRLSINNSLTPLLFNLNDDISEEHNLAEAMPDKVADLEKLVKSFESTFH